MTAPGAGGVLVTGAGGGLAGGAALVAEGAASTSSAFALAAIAVIAVKHPIIVIGNRLRLERKCMFSPFALVSHNRLVVLSSSNLHDPCKRPVSTPEMLRNMCGAEKRIDQVVEKAPPLELSVE
jgi:hypothetical protein